MGAPFLDDMQALTASGGGLDRLDQTLGTCVDWSIWGTPMSEYRIPFNRPCLIGAELSYIAHAVRSGHASGDGPYTNRCQKRLEALLRVTEHVSERLLRLPFCNDMSEPDQECVVRAVQEFTID